MTAGKENAAEGSKESSTGDQETTTLTRQLGPFSSFVICIGSVIGSGIFLVSSDIAGHVSSPLTAILVWLTAGAISMAGALIFAELGTMFPRAGGQYVFLREAFHPLIGFLFGWTLVFVIQTGSIAAVAIAFAIFVSKFYSMDALGLNICASAVIVFLTLLNFLGIKRGAQILDSVTSLKIVAIVLFVIGAIIMAPETSASSFALDLGPVTMSAFGLAMVAAFWAFDGWYSLTFVAGEVKNPEKNIPRAALLGISVVTALYIAVNLAYYAVMSPAQIAGSKNIASDAAELLFGPTGVKAMGILVIISVLGCLNAMILSGARVVYAMAKDRVLPHFFAVVSPDKHSPNRALTMQMVWSILLVWSGKYDSLYTYVIFAAFIFYGLTAFAVIFLRHQKKRHIERPYSVPFYPWLPWAYVLFCIGFTLNTLRESTEDSVKGLAVVAMGLPFYYIMKYYSKKMEQKG